LKDKEERVYKLEKQISHYKEQLMETQLSLDAYVLSTECLKMKLKDQDKSPGEVQ
jgi:ADP-glucose pyrophosphorylase